MHIVVFDKKTKICWALLVVYGAPHADVKNEFLSELSMFLSCH